MSARFPEYKHFDLSSINKEILEQWKLNDTFGQSITSREGKPRFVFYEGPPSANGMPGIHHVMARTIKDIFCRYKTLQGFQVKRKAGWDTHGLPVELGVEKMLGITKEDIGSKISVDEYNQACRKEVMKYTNEWEKLTEKMGYWVDMSDPYITYDNKYIESLWWLLKQLFEKNLLYKGYTIQPYSPAAGTGLSTHELNQPGCYRDVKDTTVAAQFKIIPDKASEFLFAKASGDIHILAWTTTPWTLPSNTALCVGPEINYLLVKTYNPYTAIPVNLILAKDRFASYFNDKNAELDINSYKEGDKNIPFQILAEFKGNEIHGVSYEQLIPWIIPSENAFKVITGDFVTTEDGTGIVHIAPTFGADDYRVAKQHSITPLFVTDKHGNTELPLVDKRGFFMAIEAMDEAFIKEHVNVADYKDFANRAVKNEYDPSLSSVETNMDVDIAVMLKKENKAFRIEKYVHSYPHCWRTDKPVLYYPLDSWFIKTTDVREKLINLNNTINWKPESTGSGRFGKWLENLVDWNLSRSRYWGTPLPIWVTEDKDEIKCIGSVAELKNEIDASIKAGFMTKNPMANFKDADFSTANYNQFDLHRPYVDQIFLVSSNGKKMYRELDLIDVWFDSGAMPYAQLHYPFENKDIFTKEFPADFIAEGVDQTRGWFFTLHAIAGMLFDSVAFKNLVSNGLVLDKNGNKMSKRLGNAVDPFTTIEKYGSDPLRWYMITNAQPWDNLKFDIEGIDESVRKFFGTLYNTYSFFSLYANVDGFKGNEPMVPLNKRSEIDRWILSLLNSMIKDCMTYYNEYEPTKAGREIQEFVTENLSNWYVRLNRKRFWGGEMNEDKLAAYQTLYTCLETISILASPIAPFFTDRLFCDLNKVSGKYSVSSVHLATFSIADLSVIDKDLEERMDLAQRYTSMVLALRRKVNIKVRQPLTKIMIPVLDQSVVTKLEAIKSLILTEVNVKEAQFLTDASGILVKKIKPNFKTLGPKYGKIMKEIAAVIATFTQDQINAIEHNKEAALTVQGQPVNITIEDVEIISEDIPGWLVANEGAYTIALDITITDELKREGIAREIINKLQNLRKDSSFDVTDRINVQIIKHELINDAVQQFKDYIATQTLAKNILVVERIDKKHTFVDINDIEIGVLIEKA